MKRYKYLREATIIILLMQYCTPVLLAQGERPSRELNFKEGMTVTREAKERPEAPGSRERHEPREIESRPASRPRSEEAPPLQPSGITVESLKLLRAKLNAAGIMATSFGIGMFADLLTTSAPDFGWSLVNHLVEGDIQTFGRVLRNIDGIKKTSIENLCEQTQLELDAAIKDANGNKQKIDGYMREKKFWDGVQRGITNSYVGQWFNHIQGAHTLERKLTLKILRGSLINTAGQTVKGVFFQPSNLTILNGLNREIYFLLEVEWTKDDSTFGLKVLGEGGKITNTKFSSIVPVNSNRYQTNGGYIFVSNKEFGYNNNDDLPLWVRAQLKLFSFGTVLEQCFWVVSPNPIVSLGDFAR